MKKQKLNNLDLSIYTETLSNGLSVLICPIKRNIIHASIAVNFGSKILDYKDNDSNKSISLPPGTAHFLEHKIFAQKNGIDPMSVFEENGASSNAYTSSDVTRYYFNCSNLFEENLKNLLDFIFNPYFTDENILKEKGIILQEAKASLDEPDESLYHLINKCLFKTHPFKDPVIGYLDTINKITKEDLYNAYNAFYNPHNMALVITGDVEPKKIINYLNNYFSNNNYSYIKSYNIVDYKEQSKVNLKYEQEKMDVSNIKLATAYKIKKPNYSDFLITTYCNLYLDILFGPMTKFYEENFNDKTFASDVYYNVKIVDDYIVIMFDTEIVKKNNIVSKIDKIIKSKKTSEELFHLVMKNVLNHLITSTDSSNSIANLLVKQYIDYHTIYYDIYDKYKNLKYDNFTKFIAELDFSNSSVAIIAKDFD